MTVLAFSIFDPVLNALKWFAQWLLQSLRSIGEAAFAQAIDAMAALVPTTDLTPVQHYWNQLNYFLPAAEFLSYSLIGLGLWLILWAYKFVKSWIPSVSS